MNADAINSRILHSRLIPAVRTPSAELAHRAIAAIAAGGVTTLELPMTVPGALAVIRDISSSPSELLVGAGTVLDESTARMAILAGAKFVVTPALSLEVIACCKRYGIPVLPGALTPTEIITAWQAGADIVKVFPASAMGGASYIKAVLAPLPHVVLMPMGGVNASTAMDYLQAGASALGVGADLVDVAALLRGDDATLTRKAREYHAIIETYSRSMEA